MAEARAAQVSPTEPAGAEAVGFGSMSDAELEAFVADPSRIHYVGMLARPGVYECSQTLEDTHYTPGTPRNDLFGLIIIHWQGLAWGLISIPADEKDFMVRAAAASGLRIANGIPHMIGPEGMSRFPANGPNVFGLENVSGHPVYGKRAGAAKKES